MRIIKNTKQYNDRVNILLITDKAFPTEHSFVKGVFIDDVPDNWKVHVFGFKGGNFEDTEREVEYFLINRNNIKAVRSLQLMVKGIFFILKDHRSYQLFFSRNDPIALILGYVLKLKNKNVKLFHQVSFLHGESFQASNKLLKRVMGNFDIYVRGKLFPAFDKIYAVSPAMQEILEEKYPAISNKFDFLTLGINANDFKDITPFHERKNDLVYIGTLTASRNLKVMIDAVAMYINKYGTVTLNIYGSSHLKEENIELERYVKDLNLESHIIFHGQVSREKVIEVLSKTKFALSLIQPLPIYRHSSPTKLMEYLAAGCYVIGNKGIVEQEKIIEESQFGTLVNFDKEDICKGIYEAMSMNFENPQAGELYIKANRNYSNFQEKIQKDYEEGVLKMPIACGNEIGKIAEKRDS